MDAQGNAKHSTQQSAPPIPGLAQVEKGVDPAGPEAGFPLPIDMHVHVVGNGLRGSGCWLKVGFWHRPLAAFMLRHIGVPASTSAPEFDETYVTHLAKLARESSLSA